MEFIGRSQDLEILRREFGTTRASLVILYGRRRIGKSTLIQEASIGRPSIYFQATLVDESLNLNAFKTEVARALGSDPVLEGVGDWLSIFHHLAKQAEEKRGLIVALDEFPYLVDGNPALPSILQKFWDSRAAEKGALKIVLCGSVISQMEELLAERNPLFGRKTLARELPPMPLREAAAFVPLWEPAEQIMAYSIFGGIPYYLSLCEPAQSLAENVERLFLATSAPLQEESDFLLRSEMSEPRRYSSIVAAIADGANKQSEIVGRVPGFKDATQVSPYLARLLRMRIVERARSIDADEHARNWRYTVQDPLFRFWHRFVRPNLSPLSLGFGSDIWKRTIQPQLNDYMGPAFETICRDHMRSYAQERFGVPAEEIGCIWGKDFDIDIAGRLLDKSAVFGECKWENTIIGETIRTRLLEAVGRTQYASDARVKHTVFFARKGFSPDLKQSAALDSSIQLIEMEELVLAPLPEPKDELPSP
jgi:uncharacterized protein